MSGAPQTVGNKKAGPSEFVLACMRHRERESRRKTKLMAWLAVPGLCLNAFFLYLIVFAIGDALIYLSGNKTFHMNWWVVLLVCVPVSVPLFWWIDGRTRQTDMLEDASPDGPGPMLSLGFGLGAFGAMAGASRGLPIFNQIILGGPRQLRKVVNRYQAASRFDEPCRARAEMALRQLLTIDHSCLVQRVLRKQEQMQELVPALAYLVFYEWISTSKDTLNVWLTGEARKTLEAAVRGGAR